MHSLALVSVVFDAEIPLIAVQATSVARYVGEQAVREVVVIDNTARGLAPAARADLLARYGTIRPAVRILRPAEICDVPAAVGWRSQQVLKLAVAHQLDSDRYLVLDAKNHFVSALQPGFVEAPDGRVRGRAHGFESHRLRPDLERVLAYLGLDAARHVGNFPATITPFTFETALVRAMTADLQSRSGRDFAREFVARDLTEFFLYSGWVASRGPGLDRVFAFDQPACPVVWPKAATAQGVADAVAEAARNAAPLFAVHRRALARLDPDGQAALARFWCERGLFGSTGEAARFVERFQRGYRRQERMQQLRDLPAKVAAVPRRLSRLERPGRLSRTG